LQVRNYPLRDFHDDPNGLQNGPSVPATASFTITWSSPLHSRDATNDFALSFAPPTVTIEWSATQSATSPSNSDGFAYVSDAANTSVTEFALIGHERNGVFFHEFQEK
jgi:hypothetical protein